MHLCLSAALKLFFLLLAGAASWPSPDNAVQAVVAQTRIEFRTNSGRLLLKRDDTSHTVIRAAWTPDSQFFVASTESADGHQPWAHPIWIYARANNRILDLSALGATAIGDFTLKSPDVLQAKVLDCAQAKKTNPASRTLTINLHRLAASGRLPNPPCPAR